MFLLKTVPILLTTLFALSTVSPAYSMESRPPDKPQQTSVANQTPDENQPSVGRLPADSIYTIPELYNSIASLDGQSVRVFGCYVSGIDSKLVTNYTTYAADELMPLNSIIFVSGALPDPTYWYGGVMIVTGVVTKSTNLLPVYPEDTIDITINAVSYEYILSVEPDTIPDIKLDDNQEGQEEQGEIKACDPCKFAILISGGGSAKSNKPTYWNNIEKLYDYKVSPTGGNYCPENVKILYYEGNSGNPSHIPHTAVDSCTKANIQKAHTDIAKKIAACERQGKPATVQKMVTNHGGKTSGIVLLGTERLPNSELRGMQQGLIDSCCDFLYDEFIQCYGGQSVDEMKKLNDSNKTEIHANSASGPGTCGWSPWNGVHTYLKEKIAALTAGDSYETSVNKAKDKYRQFLDSLQIKKNRALDSLRHILDTLNTASPKKPHLDSLKTTWVKDSTALTGSRGEGSRSFVRYIFKKYCEWKRFVIPPGGQARFDFKGKGGCGNVTIWAKDATGKWKRVEVWNWNLPGSIGYQPNNNKRVLNADPAYPSGVYWIHNDNGEFVVTIESSPHQDSTATPSNLHAFAGFSLGGRDSSFAEFGNISAPTYYTPILNMLGLDLSTVPATLGPCDGVSTLSGHFMIEQPNPWWGDMELWIRVQDVIQPGLLEVQCPTAQFPMATGVIEPGNPEIVFHLGQLQAPGMGELILSTVGGTCFTVDCWGLRSLVPTFPSYLCGDANHDAAVDISDAVYLIAYIFSGGLPPDPEAAGDANCDTAVDISDAVYLIAFIFSGGPEPCALCK